MVNTSDEDDLAYLPVLMNRNPEYLRLDVPAGASSLLTTLLGLLTCQSFFRLMMSCVSWCVKPPLSLEPTDWSLHPADKVVLGSTDASWKTVIAQLEPDTYYVKFDDDIVFVQVTAFCTQADGLWRDSMQCCSASHQHFVIERRVTTPVCCLMPVNC